MGEFRRVKIGVVGLGRMGRRHVYNLMYRVPRSQVVAVCTNLPHEIEWAQNNEEYNDFGVAIYEDYDKMLQHPGIEAVWVSTSTDVHAIQSLKGIEKGLHVLCEKPLSTDLDESQRVVDAAAKKPELKVMAAFSRRFDASYRDAAQKILVDRAIGKPFMVRSQTGDLLDTTGFFVRYATRNGSIFVDCAIHDIDLTLWYLDDPVPKACWATGSLQHHPELAESHDVDNAVGVVEYWGGKMAYYLCSRTQAHGHDVSTEITGTEGKIQVNVIPRTNKVVLCNKDGMTHEVEREYWDRFEHAFATEAQEFINSILHDTPVPLPLATGQKVMQIARALQSALWSGEVTRWNEKGEIIYEGKPKWETVMNGHAK
ncbi:NAD binding Rossmann fold oxidoreductase [Polychaeton citri CBS 116435]|uniref:NAD binding Rossmann fold oxidoreductase n=1 Tax=Polychaeton citri CBS 116435 TaxID=1314669 RepID=A0A9P4Q1R4_9PEZI|nr:NAD binding Rossmann fold oxidoreductase [Polychaeton citri CBS 116435]